MAYDPATGTFKEEELSVEKRLRGLLSRDSPYLEQGRTEALKQANRRGLLNSSMAVQAGEAARIDRALPIASQDAGQAHERYQTGRQIQASDIQQRRDITSREGMQRAGFEHETGMQTRDIESRERMQGVDNTAARERLELDIGSRERMQGAEFQHQQALQQREADERRWLAQFDAQTQERLQGLDAATRQSMQALDVETQLRIANMNVAAAERNNAASLAASFEASYSSMLASIAANPEIPAAERQRLVDHAARIRDSNLALVEQMYGIDLQWGDAPAGTSGTGGSAPTGGTSSGGTPTLGPAGGATTSTANLRPLDGSGMFSFAKRTALMANGFTHYDPATDEVVNPTTGERRKRDET